VDAGENRGLGRGFHGYARPHGHAYRDVSHQHAHQYQDGFSHPNPYSDTLGFADPVGVSNRNSHSYFHRNLLARHIHSHTRKYAYFNTHRGCDGNPHEFDHADGSPYKYGHLVEDLDFYPDSDTNGYMDSHRKQDPDENGDADLDFQSGRDPHGHVPGVMDRGPRAISQPGQGRE
jgi:hypothetical protein